MTQCISRRRGSDLRPSIMRPVCFLQIARVRDACLLSLPPWAALLLTGWWVYIPTLPLSQQSVAVDLPLRLVSVSLFVSICPSASSSVLPLLLTYINTSALCSCFSVFCFLSSPVQCSSVPWYPLGCYPGYLAVPLVCFGSYLAVPTQGGGSQRGQSPACWRRCLTRFQAVIARIVAL